MPITYLQNRQGGEEYLLDNNRTGKGKRKKKAGQCAAVLVLLGESLQHLEDGGLVVACEDLAVVPVNHLQCKVIWSVSRLGMCTGREGRDGQWAY